MKLTALSLIATLACAFGCNQQEKVEKVASVPSTLPQIIRVCNPGPFTSLHPHMGIDLQCRIFQSALFEGLTCLDVEGKPSLSGAEKLEISPSKTIYTFTLRPMHWTNGECVTAFQFEKAWKWALTPGSPCLRSDLFYPIKNAKAAKLGEVSLEDVGIYALDAHTLVVELEHPTPYFLDLIATPLFAPLFDENLVPTVFNGPFYIAQHIPYSKMVLRKNHGYWGAGQVATEIIDVAFIADSSTALHLYEKGEIDWAGHPFTQLPHDALPRLKESPEFHSVSYDGIYWLCVNTDIHSLSSSKIRRALSLALDRDGLAHHVLLGETPTRTLIATGISTLGKEDSNHKMAKSLFKEGLADLHLTSETFPQLILSHSDVPEQKKLAEAIQECWQSVLGIDIKLQNNEWNVFFASLGERQFQIGGCLWFAPFHDPMYYLEFFKEKGHRYNATQWENNHYQQLLELANQEKDQNVRQEHLFQAESVLLDEMPIIPLYVFHAKYLKSPHLKHLEVNHTGQIDFRWAKIE